MITRSRYKGAGFGFGFGTWNWYDLGMELSLLCLRPCLGALKTITGPLIWGWSWASFVWGPAWVRLKQDLQGGAGFNLLRSRFRPPCKGNVWKKGVTKSTPLKSKVVPSGGCSFGFFIVANLLKDLFQWVRFWHFKLTWFGEGVGGPSLVAWFRKRVKMFLPPGHRPVCYVDDCDAEQHQLEKIRVLDSPEDAKSG